MRKIDQHRQVLLHPLASGAPTAEHSEGPLPSEPTSPIDEFTASLIEGYRRVSADPDLSYELTLRGF